MQKVKVLKTKSGYTVELEIEHALFCLRKSPKEFKVVDDNWEYKDNEIVKKKKVKKNANKDSKNTKSDK